jgi:hypothetical protein
MTSKALWLAAIVSVVILLIVVLAFTFALRG